MILLILQNQYQKRNKKSKEQSLKLIAETLQIFRKITEANKTTMNNMKTLLIFFLGFFPISIFAQEGNVAGTLKGKVMDMNDNPIAYTNIGLEGTYFGTASNSEGEFELKIPDDFTSYRIFFSAVGYKNSMLVVSDLLEKDFNIIRLQEQSYSIDDIDVNAQSKVLYQDFKDGV